MNWLLTGIKLIAFLFFTLVAGLLVLRFTGMAIPYKVPDGSMAPTIEPGDHVVMEGFTYLKRSPQRGDLVTFRRLEIAPLTSRSPKPRESKFVMRLAGLPGETLRIENGRLIVNGAPVSLSNAAGEIRYHNDGEFRTSNDAITVPPDHYFVLGDRTDHSLDSRFWGTVPAGNITGRVIYCYAPIRRMGPVR